MRFAIERMGEAAYFASVSHPDERRRVWAEYQQTQALLAQFPDAVNAAWNDTVLDSTAGALIASIPALGKGPYARRVGRARPTAGLASADEVLSQTGLLYRGDTRGPSIIFEDGFVPQKPGSNVTLEDYVDFNPYSNFVSTTKNPPTGAAIEGSPEYFGTAYGEKTGYVYTIDNPGGGIDVNKMYPGAAFPNENEIAFPGGINTNCIVGCIPVAPNGVPTGPFIPNSNYTGGIQ